MQSQLAALLCAASRRRFRHRSPRGLAAVVTGLLAAASLPTLAQSDIEQASAAMAKLIGTLADQGVLSRDKAQTLLKDVATPPAPAAAGAKPVPGAPVRVGHVPQFIRDEMKRELRDELTQQAAREGWAGPGAVPAWSRSITVDGDVRLRYQGDLFADGNAPAVSVSETNRNRAVTLANTSEDRNRFRVRARIGINAALDPNWSAGARLSTGSATDPLSSNQTLGTYGNRFNVAFDRAFIRWRPVEQINAVVGRFGNPWFGSDLVWANDLSFDGLAVQWTPKVGNVGSAFFTAAAMPVQEVELSTADKWLFGVQAGFEAPRLFGAVAAKVALGYYSYRNTVGIVSAPAGSTRNEFTAPAFAQKGNTYYNISSDPNRPLLGLAAEYQLVNLTGSLALPLGDKRLVLSGDVVRNLGFNRADVARRTGQNLEAQTLGWQLRMALGHAEVARLGDWQVFAGYKRLERDAVPDAFTDSDFRLGGTDAKGYFLGGSFGLGKNTAIGLRWLSSDAISGPPLAVDVVQIDLNVRY